MSKKYRAAQKRYYKRNKTQQSLVKLERIMKRSDDENDISLANSIRLYFVRNGYLSKAWKEKAAELIKKYPEITKPKVKEGRHYLYAVSDGEFVKVGFAVNVHRRLREMQTSSPKTLKLKWYKYCSEDSKEAKRQETKLHRHIRKHHYRGEWFKKECLEQIYRWHVRNRETREEEKGIIENEALDNEYHAVMGQEPSK